MKKLYAIIGLIAVLLVPSALSVFAQQSGQGLEISPPLINQAVDPGQSVRVEIRVRNITNTEVIAKGRIDDFVAKGESGEPHILTDEDAEPSPYTFKPWVGTVPNLELAPQEVKTATVTIDVPKDASPGGHYGVIRFTAVPVGLDESGVSLSASIGTLVLLSVSGDVVESAEVEEFSVRQGDGSGTFFERGPLTFTQRIKNTGNVHFQPEGSVSVKNMFGKEIATFAVNEAKGNVLPNSIRKFEQEYKERALFGRFSATLDITYGSQQERLTETIVFWVIPWKLILIIIVGLSLLIALIVVMLKRYKKHVTEAVRQQNTQSRSAPESEQPPTEVSNPRDEDDDAAPNS